jgi:tetratricopeptide (TPR) repeat protein
LTLDGTHHIFRPFSDVEECGEKFEKYWEPRMTRIVADNLHAGVYSHIRVDARHARLNSLLFFVAAKCLALLAVTRYCSAGDDAPRDTLAKLNAAIKKHPDQADAYLYRGLIWQELREPERAIEDFDVAIRLDPTSAGGFAHRAIVWQELGNLEKAAADFSMAIRLDPKDASNYFLRGIVRQARGELDLAIKDWTTALRIEPQNAEAYMHRALAWGMKDDFEKALQDCAAALQINPRMRPVWQLQAWIRATCADGRFRDGSRAVASAQKACVLSAWKDSLAIETLAAAYAEIGDFTAAVRWQKKAIAMLGAGTAALADARLRLSLYESQKPFRDESK